MSFQKLKLFYPKERVETKNAIIEHNINHINQILAPRLDSYEMGQPSELEWRQ